jgi:hypothetical protein
MKVQARKLEPHERAALPGSASERTTVLVRHPGGKELSADGEDVPKTQYWMTCLKQGSITLVKEAAPRIKTTTTRRATRRTATLDEGQEN